MNGAKVLADTNVFINLAEGKGDIESRVLNRNFECFILVFN
jgi:hypothetical protein